MGCFAKAPREHSTVAVVRRDVGLCLVPWVVLSVKPDKVEQGKPINAGVVRKIYDRFRDA